MNKKELISHVQRAMGPGATRRTATAAVDAVLESIVALAHREPLHLTGFGTFSRRTHEASEGYDITRACMKERAAYSTLAFRAAKGLLPELRERMRHPELHVKAVQKPGETA